MTGESGAKGDDGAHVSAYEDLRRDVLAGSAFGHHAGLVVLLRQGLAGWMACRPTGARREPAVERRSCAASAVVSDELRAGVVRVLAGMVAHGRRELST